MNKVKTIFIGTSEFAVPILEAALAHPLLEVVAVVTQPDRPAGREQELKPPEVKQFLLDKNINLDILQPEKIREISEELLQKYQPELILVASYGQIIPNNMLEFPKYKALNFHGSLLPKLRGAVPVPMAILSGLKETGVTLQVMAEKMDVGDIVSTRTYQLKDDETAESLMSELSKLSVEILNQDLEKWISGEIKVIPQDESQATYCHREDISKEKAELKYATDLNLAERMIRALYPWPVAWIELPERGRLKIFKAKIANKAEILNSNIKNELTKGSNPLKIIKFQNRLFLILQNGSLELLEVQLEGKKRAEAKNYLFLAS